MISCYVWTTNALFHVEEFNSHQINSPLCHPLTKLEPVHDVKRHKSKSVSSVITSFVTTIFTSLRRCSLNVSLKLRVRSHEAFYWKLMDQTNKINSRFPINSWNINLRSSLNKRFSLFLLFAEYKIYRPFIRVRDGSQFKLIGLDFSPLLSRHRWVASHGNGARIR